MNFKSFAESHNCTDLETPIIILFIRFANVKKDTSLCLSFSFQFYWEGNVHVHPQPSWNFHDFHIVYEKIS